MENISLITTLLVVFVAAIAGAIIARKMHVPVLLGYIASGIVFGNIFPSIIDQKFLMAIAQIGVTLLLFTLGVECSFHRLSKVLHVISLAAIVQILVSILVFFLLFIVLRMPVVPALFLAVAASLSSTAVVVKILSERGELTSVPGEVLTGWLVIQDVSVIPIMVLLPAIVTASETGATAISQIIPLVGISIIKAGIFLVLVLVLGRGIAKLLSGVASLGSRELFLVVTIAIVFLAAVGSFVFGLPAAIGAFIAGLLISETSQNHAVFAEVRPLRDVFVVVFFVAIGLGIPIAFFVREAPLLIGLTAGVFGIKWAISMGLMRFLGFHRKTSFLVAIGLLPMSEFGFVIAQAGLSLHGLNMDQYVFLVGLTFATIFAGSPLLTHGQRLYYWWNASFGKYIPKIFSQDERMAPGAPFAMERHVIICGYGRVGKYVGRALTMAGIPFLVIDYNHTTVAHVRVQGIPVVYGDPADAGILRAANVDRARAILIAIPDKHTQEIVIAGVQTVNKKIRIICRSHHEEDQPRLKSLGVSLIVQPEFEAALAIVEKLLPEFGVPPEELPGKIARLKIEHGLG